jgi:3-methylfumaryl-CoA hydratase
MSHLAELLSDWHPGSTEMTRRVDPWPAGAFADLIGTLPPRDTLPPLWHRLVLLDHPAHAETGADGHPLSDPFLPPIPPRRRMFAGGRLRQDKPIPFGADLTRRSTVAGSSVKQGRGGELVFVTVRHELSADGTPVGVEEHDIVYPPGAGTPPAPPAPLEPAVPQTPVPGEWRLELPTDPVLLFRFSALTYNGHRIHYDQPYATQVEGYPGLVIHGPLMALLALELPRVHGRPVREFSYRLVRPAFAPATLVAAGTPEGTALVGAHGAEPSLRAEFR